MFLIYSMYTGDEVSPYIEHVASGLPNPTRSEGGGGGVRFVQAQDQQVTTRSPR